MVTVDLYSFDLEKVHNMIHRVTNAP